MIKNIHNISLFLSFILQIVHSITKKIIPILSVYKVTIISDNNSNKVITIKHYRVESRRQHRVTLLITLPALVQNSKCSVYHIIPNKWPI